VQGGTISVTGAGLDASRTDYTDLIARAVQVNAGIWAHQLEVTTGANHVDTTNNTVAPITGTGAVPTVSIDVAQLGGMYAGKITLVGTEAGVGVRNAGNIGATAGELVLTVH
jgi:filamentous hemagglutinin